jgi:8-oxo-dGTP pyrophosphatase MutT (NUDIX family)
VAGFAGRRRYGIVLCRSPHNRWPRDWPIPRHAARNDADILITLPIEPQLNPSDHASSDNEAYRFPVSVKGVIIRRGRVILLKNERDEWELPGGKLELDETPAACVAREIAEELQLRVEATKLVDAWVYTIEPGVHVVILTYGCTELAENDAMLSDEHQRLAWFAIDDVDSLDMPEGYKASIRRWVSDGPYRP